MLISLDSETTGIDLYHGAKPFLVTTCSENGQQRFWEWDVDPLTREPIIPTTDLAEIGTTMIKAKRIVAQNGKFDCHALEAIGLTWPWDKVDDTLCAGHLLASNRGHRLDQMVLERLDQDIQPFEDRMKAAVNEARRLVRSARLRVRNGKADGEDEELASWRIAEEGLAEMPSARDGSKRDKSGAESEKPWKFDCWLPRAFAKRFAYEPDHPWWTVTADYANKDSEVTLLLWLSQRADLEARGLMPYYLEKLRSLPALAELETRGTTLLMGDLHDMRTEYREDIVECEAVCRGIAEGMGYDLTLPKSGNNGSLHAFCFGDDGDKHPESNGEACHLNLPVLKRTETGRPSLDKEVIEEYKKVLPAGSKQLLFVNRLSRARKRAKSCDFLDAYEVFGVPGPGEIAVLHPSVNPTATATTRFSMSNPNLQQVSKQESQCERCLGEGCELCNGTGSDLRSIRLVFGPGPGREWWAMDAENIELRLPAYESGERSLIDLFERSKEPPFYGSQHLLNFSIVYDDLWQEELRAVGLDKVGPHCKKKYAAGPYHWTKGGGLAMQYQCGEATADRAFHRRGGFAKIKAHFRAMDGLNAKYVRHAYKHGYVETMPDRSICPERGYPLFCGGRSSGGISPTVPLNYHVQGTAGWWMVRAINRCHALLVEWRASGFDAWIALTVHDELVFDFPKSFTLKNGEPSNLGRARQLAAAMRRGGDDVGVPTPVSINWCPTNWAEGKSFKA